MTEARTCAALPVNPKARNTCRSWLILKASISFKTSLGFTGKAAQVRAYVTYFHQTGYNAMQVSEPREERLLNIPYYAEVLTNRPDLLGLKTAEDVSEHFASRKSET